MMHLYGFFQVEKVFNTYFTVFRKKKKKSPLSFCDLIDYSNSKDLLGLPRWLSDKEH